MAKKKKYYVVWKGRQAGVFDSWEECSAQVSGFPGAEFKAFDSRGAAEEAFCGEYADYRGKQAPALTPEQLAAIGAPILDSYSVDAACSGPPGPVEYRCVYTRTRELIFQQGPFANGTNNIGEFLAIVHALAWCKQRGSTLPIYSDSENAILWVRQKRANTQLARDERNEELFDLIARAERWLRESTYPNEILKWETEAWGEIPADFGRK